MLSRLKPSNLHLDILMGQDKTIEPVDIFGGMEAGPPVDFHKELARQPMQLLKS
jgi:proteasome maturation protein